MPTIDIPDQDPRVQYTANVGQTTFVYNFLIRQAGDLRVILDGVVQTITTDYTVTNVGVVNGGTIIFTSPTSGGEIVTILRRTSIDRDSQYQIGGEFRASAVEKDFDDVFLILQEQRTRLSRTARLSDDDTLVTFEFPTNRENKFLSFDSAGSPIAVDGSTSAGTPFGATGIDLAATGTPSAARTVLELGSLALLDEISGSNFGTTTNTGNAYEVTTSPVTGSLGVGGNVFCIFFNAANTGNVTLNVNGLGAESVLDLDGSEIPSGGIVAGRLYILIWDGSDFRTSLTDIPVDSETGTTYTFLAGDKGKLKVFLNASPIAVTLPQAGTTGFENGWNVNIDNRGDGLATVTPTTSTIDGQATLTLRRGSNTIYSDGTNYFTRRPAPATFFDNFIFVADEKASGTEGGTPTTGSYQTRTLNTVKSNTIVGASLGSNVITLPAGRYFAQGRTPLYRANRFKAKLRDTTNNVDLALGESAFSANEGGTNDSAVYTEVSGEFTLSATANVALQYRAVASTGGTSGLGAASSFGDVETYSTLKIWKL